MSAPSLTFFCGVQCVVFGADSASILLGRRARTSAEGQWALPGGHVEELESPLDTARRELREETGLEGLSAEVLPSFFTWRTERRYAHFPVIFTESVGEPALQEGELFSALSFFPLDSLPTPLFEPSRLTLEALQGSRQEVKLRGNRHAFIQLEMLALHVGDRKNAAWTLRAFLGEDKDELIITWGRRMAKSRNVRRQVFIGRSNTMKRIRELVTRRLRHGYCVVGLSGDVTPDGLAAWFPELHLSVVSTQLLTQLSVDPAARAAYMGESAAGKLAGQLALWGTQAGGPVAPGDEAIPGLFELE
jgi:8-oxo-dGTP diphosphatase